MYLIGRNTFTSDNIKLSEVIFMAYFGLSSYPLKLQYLSNIIRNQLSYFIMRALACSCDSLKIWVAFWVTVNTRYLIQYLWYLIQYLQDLIWYLQDLILDLIFPSVKTIRNKKRLPAFASSLSL